MLVRRRRFGMVCRSVVLRQSFCVLCENTVLLLRLQVATPTCLLLFLLHPVCISTLLRNSTSRFFGVVCREEVGSPAVKELVLLPTRPFPVAHLLKACLPRLSPGASFLLVRWLMVKLTRLMLVVTVTLMVVMDFALAHVEG